MKKYYSVISKFDDHGNASAVLGDTVMADQKPEGTMECLSRYDLYTDWFATKKEAKEFAKGVK